MFWSILLKIWMMSEIQSRQIKIWSEVMYLLIQMQVIAEEAINFIYRRVWLGGLCQQPGHDRRYCPQNPNDESGRRIQANRGRGRGGRGRGRGSIVGVPLLFSSQKSIYLSILRLKRPWIYLRWWRHCSGRCWRGCRL